MKTYHHRTFLLRLQPCLLPLLLRRRPPQLYPLRPSKCHHRPLLLWPRIIFFLKIFRNQEIRIWTQSGFLRKKLRQSKKIQQFLRKTHKRISKNSSKMSTNSIWYNLCNGNKNGALTSPVTYIASSSSSASSSASSVSASKSSSKALRVFKMMARFLSAAVFAFREGRPAGVDKSVERLGSGSVLVAPTAVAPNIRSSSPPTWKQKC